VASATGRGITQFARQIAHLDLLAGRHHGQPVAKVFQLPNVALEIQTRTDTSGQPRTSPLGFDTQFAGTLLQEMAREQRNILAPLAQCRQADTDDVQAVEQVFTEQTVLDPRFQILVGRRDDANVGLDRRMPADPVESAHRTRTRSKRVCSSEGMSPISSRNSVPPFCLLKATASLRLGAGKRAALVAEEFGFEQDPSESPPC
jgi:hypothetical protein